MDSSTLSRRAEADTSRRNFLSGACLLAVATFPGWSTDSVAQTASEANDIIRSLAPTRGQVVTPGYGEEYRRPVVVDQTTIFMDVRHTVSLEVYFEFNSAKITPRAKAQLRALGRALSSPELKPYRYLIAGHTDAVGSDEFNLDLSRRRAIAVRKYLVSVFPIDPRRLLSVGFGLRQLKRPETPYAAVNRRVEVALIV